MNHNHQKILEAYAKGYKDGADAVKGIKDENNSVKPNNCEDEPQAEDEILREQCRAFMSIVEQTERE